jgi:predicted ATP-grasp superfamily ATP-dependent carboligase
LSPRRAALDLVLDKRATLARAAALGIDVPDNWQPRPDDDTTARAATLCYPRVLKWADPPAILPTLAAHAIPFIKAEHVADAAALTTALARYDVIGAWPLVQGYCPGTGLGQMFFIHDGSVTLTFQHRRIHEWPPEGGTSTVCAAVPLDEHSGQRAKSEALLAGIGWQGAAMVEYRYDPATGRYWLMEINGRFWGSLPLARHAGAQFAWETYARALGIEPQQPEPKLRHARYTIPETRRLFHVFARRPKIADRQYRATPWRDLASYIGDVLDPGMRYFVWDWRDPMPFFADMAAVVRKIVRRGTPNPD